MSSRLRSEPAVDGGSPAWPPKVLHVIPSLAIGGTESQLVQFIARSSAPDRHRVAVFDEAGVLAARLPVPPIDVGPLSRDVHDLVGNLRAIRRLRSLVRQLRPDVVHAHLGISEVVAAAALPRGVPLVSSHRGLNVGLRSRRSLRVLEGMAHRRVAVLICNSQSLADRARRSDLWPPPTRVLHNAVDPEVFRPVPLPPLDRPAVVVVANLGPEKGHETLLTGLSLLRARGRPVRAILVGEGPERPRIHQLIARLGLEGDVTLPGHVLDIRPFVAEAQVVALTSVYEGFPNALLEGMAMGRPVVATRVGGIPELVGHRRHGLLVDPGQPAAVADALDALFGNRPLLERLGAAATRWAQTFGWERLIRETEELYRSVAVRTPDRAEAR